MSEIPKPSETLTSPESPDLPASAAGENMDDEAAAVGMRRFCRTKNGSTGRRPSPSDDPSRNLMETR